MASSLDYNLRNLFSLYDFIGTNFAESRLVADDNFSFLVTEKFVWPNVLYGFDEESLSEDIISGTLRFYADSIQKPILVFKETTEASRMFRKCGFMPIERWVSMDHTISGTEIFSIPSFGNYEVKQILEESQFEDYAELISGELFSGKSVSPALFSMFAKKGHEVIGLFFNHKLIATALVYYDEFGYAGVYMVCVSKHLQGKGFGKIIMARCFNYIKEKGVLNVVLQSTKKGIALYERLGFNKGINYNLYWKI